MDFVLNRPKLASTCIKFLSLLPIIHEKLISYASNEGLITYDHGPVPKEKKNKNKKTNLDKQAQDFEGKYLTPQMRQEKITSQDAQPKGKNHAHKSPLEKWFY